MILSERHRQVLAAVINQYIDEAEPVSSLALAEAFCFDVSPATLRNDLALLETAGYLTHLYTSSGRVPTDYGYRLYVDELLEPRLRAGERRLIQAALAESQASWDALCLALAQCTNAYTLVADASGAPLSNSRLTLVLRQPEFIDHEQVMNFLSLVEQWLDSHGQWLARRVNQSPQFLIGREMATWSKGIDEFALAAMDFQNGRRRVRILMFGPKRLPYPKIAAAFDFLKSSALI